MLLKIKELRKSRGWTVRELGEKMSVSHVTISNWENDVSEPDIKSIIKLSQIFNVTTDYLFGIDSNISLQDIKNSLYALDKNSLINIFEKQIDLIEKIQKDPKS